MGTFEDSKWMDIARLERARKMKNFVDENGRFPKLKSDDNYERSLGNWRTRRKIEYKEGKLSSVLIEFLEQIPGWTWSSDIEEEEEKEKVGKSLVDENEWFPIAQELQSWILI